MVDFPASHGWLLGGHGPNKICMLDVGLCKTWAFLIQGIVIIWNSYSQRLDDGLNHSGRKWYIWWQQNWHPGPADTDQHRFNGKPWGQNTFYFSTSVAYEDRIETEKTRQEQNNAETKTTTLLELFNLDAENMGSQLSIAQKCANVNITLGKSTGAS